MVLVAPCSFLSQAQLHILLGAAQNNHRSLSNSAAAPTCSRAFAGLKLRLLVLFTPLYLFQGYLTQSNFNMGLVNIVF